jgi:hypothetical protein
VRFLTRFTRIERPRAAGAQERPASGERFQALETSAAIPDLHSGALERFAPPTEPALELAPRSEAQPFVRCPRCGVDAWTGARRCQCGGPLDTPEVQAFNAELWARHREEQAASEEQLRRTRTEEIEGARRLHEARQALGEEIAREVATRERRARSGAPSAIAGAILLIGALALLLGRTLGFGRLAALAAISVLGYALWRARSRAARRAATAPETHSTVDH